MDNEQLFEFMTKMYAQMEEGFGKVDAKLNGVENEISGLKTEITKTNLIIENEIKPKADMLFEGQELLHQKIDNIKEENNKKLDSLLMESTRHTTRLDKIEKAVVEHDEILFRRVK